MSTSLDLKIFLAFFRLSLLMLANTNCFHTRFSMTFLSCARRIEDKKKRRGFHGKLFHRLANTSGVFVALCCSICFSAHIFHLQPVSRLFPRKHASVGDDRECLSSFYSRKYVFRDHE